MIPEAAFDVSSFDVLAFFALAVALFALFRWLRRLLPQVGLGRTRRAALRRALPILEAMTYLLYAVVALPVLLDDHPEITPVALTVVVAGSIAISWFALRDFVAGVFVKGAPLCTVGDYVRFGEAEGRVLRLDIRTMAIETPTGDEAIIPYSQLSGRSLVRTPIPEGAYRHAFVVTPPEGVSMPDAEAAIRRHALNSHWSSIVREPQVEPLSEGALQVTVFALEQRRGPDIEAAVRRALG